MFFFFFFFEITFVRIVVNTIAISRGQNINVTLELEGMLSDIDTVKIIQCDNRSCNSRKSLFFR